MMETRGPTFYGLLWIAGGAVLTAVVALIGGPGILGFFGVAGMLWGVGSIFDGLFNRPKRRV